LPSAFCGILDLTRLFMNRDTENIQTVSIKIRKITGV
jgi:hypothetical protein